MIYRECEYCGANLDPGERCDCLERARNRKSRLMSLFESDGSGQLVMKSRGSMEDRA